MSSTRHVLTQLKRYLIGKRSPAHRACGFQLACPAHLMLNFRRQPLKCTCAVEEHAAESSWPFPASVDRGAAAVDSMTLSERNDPCPACARAPGHVVAPGKTRRLLIRLRQSLPEFAVSAYWSEAKTSPVWRLTRRRRLSALEVHQGRAYCEIFALISSLRDFGNALCARQSTSSDFDCGFRGPACVPDWAKRSRRVLSAANASPDRTAQNIFVDFMPRPRNRARTCACVDRTYRMFCVVFEFDPRPRYGMIFFQE